MEGMPASSSTAVPIGRRSMVGHISTRKKATPPAIGSERARATAEVIRVPTIGPAPPKTPATGSHVESMRNEKPNFAIAGQPPISSDTRMPPSAASSAVAAAKQVARKIHSNEDPRGDADRLPDAWSEEIATNALRIDRLAARPLDPDP